MQQGLQTHWTKSYRATQYARGCTSSAAGLFEFEHQAPEEYTPTSNSVTTSSPLTNISRNTPNQKPWLTMEVKVLLRQCSQRRPEQRHQGGQNSIQEKDWAPEGVQYLTNYKTIGTTMAEGKCCTSRGPERLEVATIHPPICSNFMVHTEGDKSQEGRWTWWSDREGPQRPTQNSWSLTNHRPNPCSHNATIIKLPRKTIISSLNNYGPVALTLVVMKCFEKQSDASFDSLTPHWIASIHIGPTSVYIQSYYMNRGRHCHGASHYLL